MNQASRALLPDEQVKKTSPNQSLGMAHFKNMLGNISIPLKAFASRSHSGSIIAVRYFNSKINEIVLS